MANNRHPFFHLKFLKSKLEMSYTYLTPEEAASFIQNGQQIAFSGFTPAGATKAIPVAIAAKAEKEHAEGRPFKVSVLTGASSGDLCEGVLARAKAISYRAPYQTNNDIRAAANANELSYTDLHLSMMPQYMNYGFMGKIDWAIVEAADVNDKGEILLTTSVGISPTGLKLADKILKCWQGYTDEDAFVFANTNDEPHNTITPIARFKNGLFELDLVLRNNITTPEHPLGVYHPHSELHNIKKENMSNKQKGVL